MLYSFIESLNIKKIIKQAIFKMKSRKEAGILEGGAERTDLLLHNMKASLIHPQYKPFLKLSIPSS